jgi:hypothetical protein
VTAQVTAEQDFDLVSGIVQEAIYFDFYGEHPDHGDTFDLTVGVCDDPVVEGRMAVLLFPAVVNIFDPDLLDGDAFALVAGIVRDAIDGWYETPKRFRLGFIGIDVGRSERIRSG